jgi:heme exporter protein CcmD
MKEFIYAGGYGLYLWSAFAVTAVLMVGEVVVERRLFKKVLARLKRIKRMEQA